MARKLAVVIAAVAAVGVLIGLYVSSWATTLPRTIVAGSALAATGASTELTLQTDAAVGPQDSPGHPDCVSYLVKQNGHWVRSTIFKVPAHALVKVTVYQFDGDSGLRNPFLSQVQGTVGASETVDGKAINHIDPEEASHTFVIPQLGVFVPLPGVPEEAKNQCEYGPCDPNTMAHRCELSRCCDGPGHIRSTLI